MSLLERYMQGQGSSVYDEINAMGERAFLQENNQEVLAILAETMNRVSYNLEVIYEALRKTDYCFCENPKHDFEYPLSKPDPDTPFHIARLESAVRPFGYLPLSLKMFLAKVGSCNFAWDYNANPNIPWEGSDPIQIFPARPLLNGVEILESYEEDDPIGLPLSADYYHKDNISGGPPYSIELTENPQIDSRFLNEEHDTTFINYLRITFDNCGFSRAYVIEDRPDFM